MNRFEDPGRLNQLRKACKNKGPYLSHSEFIVPNYDHLLFLYLGLHAWSVVCICLSYMFAGITYAAYIFNVGFYQVLVRLICQHHQTESPFTGTWKSHILLWA